MMHSEEGSSIPADDEAALRRAERMREMLKLADQMEETLRLLRDNSEVEARFSTQMNAQEALKYLKRAQLDTGRVRESRARHEVLDEAKKETQARTDEKLREAKAIVHSITVRDSSGRAIRLTVDQSYPTVPVSVELYPLDTPKEQPPTEAQDRA